MLSEDLQTSLLYSQCGRTSRASLRVEGTFSHRSTIHRQVQGPPFDKLRDRPCLTPAYYQCLTRYASSPSYSFSFRTHEPCVPTFEVIEIELLDNYQTTLYLATNTLTLPIVKVSLLALQIY